MGAHDRQAMLATRSHRTANVSTTTTEAKVSENIGGDWPEVTIAEAMPVCLRGDRLEFQSPCHLHSELMGIVALDWSETEGESYDGASILWIAWSIVGHPLQQEFRWPSYWHDRLCENSRTWSERRLADAMLLVLLEKEKVGYLRRTAMWAAVRLYAWLWWSWRRWLR